MQSKVWLVMAAAMVLLGSCDRSKGDALTPEGFGARADGDTRWGVVDSRGRYVVQNAYDNPPTAMTDGMYYVEDTDGEYNIYSASDPQKACNIAPFEQLTAFFKGTAYATRRGTPIFVIDHACNPLKVLPDTVWEVRLAGTRKTVFAYRDQLGRWGVLDGSGNVAEVACCETYEDFCVSHADLFISSPEVPGSLAAMYGDILPVNPLDNVAERMYVAKTTSGWALVNGAGETVGDTRWREYAFAVDHGKDFVAQLSTGAYRLFATLDGKASPVGDLAFAAVSCRTNTSVKSGTMYPRQGCEEICDYLMSLDLNVPDTVTTVIPVATDAAYYRLTTFTVPDIEADVFIAKSTIDTSHRLMAVVKIMPQGRVAAADDFPRMLRNLIYAMETDIEHRTGWDRVGGESHALCYGSNERYIYFVPFSTYIVAVVSTDRLDYATLTRGALNKMINS